MYICYLIVALHQIEGYFIHPTYVRLYFCAVDTVVFSLTVNGVINSLAGHLSAPGA